MTFIGHKAVVALFAKDVLQNLRHGSQWTMTISPGSSEDCYVDIVTDMSSADIVKTVALNYSGALSSISIENTPFG